MSSETRRWKKAADAAVAPELISAERARVALELAARYAGSGGNAGLGGAGLEMEMARFVEDSWVLAALAAKRLDTVRMYAAQADYEDRRSLAAESAWTEQYLMPVLLRPLQTRIQPPAAETETWSNHLFAALAEEVTPRLKMVLAA